MIGKSQELLMCKRTEDMTGAGMWKGNNFIHMSTKNMSAR